MGGQRRDTHTPRRVVCPRPRPRRRLRQRHPACGAFKPASLTQPCLPRGDGGIRLAPARFHLRQRGQAAGICGKPEQGGREDQRRTHRAGNIYARAAIYRRQLRRTFCNRRLPALLPHHTGTLSRRRHIVDGCPADREADAEDRRHHEDTEPAERRLGAYVFHCPRTQHGLRLQQRQSGDMGAQHAAQLRLTPSRQSLPDRSSLLRTGRPAECRSRS